MVLGFNHNIQYKGEIFHIQTEDSGVESPHIITLLYRGGTIVSSRKTSYADIIRVENLEKVVEELMKEQHKEMLRRLKSGEFDERAFGPAAAGAVAAVAADEPQPETRSDSPQAPSPIPDEECVNKYQSLDEIILDYLLTGGSEEQH